MPRLNELIQTGFCAGYGDGDFRVSAAVEKLSKKELDELKLITLTALQVADDMWKRGQPVEQADVALPNPANDT